MSAPSLDTDLKSRLRCLFGGDQGDAAERDAWLSLLVTFAALPAPPDPFGYCPDYGRLHEQFVAALAAPDPDFIEERFVALYAHLHGHEVPLTTPERSQFRARHGYLSHVGGLSPILKAGAFITGDTVSADYGAGNGLQGLLLQLLYPHRRTVQIEISGQLVETGRALQEWLGIPAARVEWLNADVGSVSPAEIDFVYIYRPVRPVGEGRAFYESFAGQVAASGRPRVIFSIADCLRDFLPGELEVFYSDGHLTCFRRRA